MVGVVNMEDKLSILIAMAPSDVRADVVEVFENERFQQHSDVLKSLDESITMNQSIPSVRAFH